jgi:hypothetical protein
MTDIKITDIIEGLINQEATDYAASIAGPYAFSIEQATARVVTVIGPDQREEVLRYLIDEKMHGDVFVCCLLDEALDESYAKVHELAGLLAEEVIRQTGLYPTHTADAITELVKADIGVRGTAIWSTGHTERRLAAGLSPY